LKKLHNNNLIHLNSQQQTNSHYNVHLNLVEKQCFKLNDNDDVTNGIFSFQTQYHFRTLADLCGETKRDMMDDR